MKNEQHTTRPHPCGHCFWARGIHHWFAHYQPHDLHYCILAILCAQMYPPALSSLDLHRTATRDSKVSEDDANAHNLFCACMKAECVKIRIRAFGDPINYLKRNKSDVNIKLESH